MATTLASSFPARNLTEGTAVSLFDRHPSLSHHRQLCFTFQSIMLCRRNAMKGGGVRGVYCQIINKTVLYYRSLLGKVPGSKSHSHAVPNPRRTSSRAHIQVKADTVWFLRILFPSIKVDDISNLFSASIHRPVVSIKRQSVPK